MTTTAPVYGRDLPEQPIGTVLTLDCPTCEQQFQWLSEPGMQGPQTYCSRRCKNRGRRNNMRANRIALDDLSPDVVATGELRLLLCIRCEQMFGWRPLRAENTEAPRTCSPACSDAMHRRRQKARQTERELLREQRRIEHEANELKAWRRKALKALQAGDMDKAAEWLARIDERLGIDAPASVAPAPEVDAEHAARVEAASAAARELLLPATHCVRCNKVASPTKEAAKEAKRAIETRTRRTNEVRYYECPEGYWHWTSWV